MIVCFLFFSVQSEMKFIGMLVGKWEINLFGLLGGFLCWLDFL